jgi:putative addiction module component (TIGR02574 family)
LVWELICDWAAQNLSWKSQPRGNQNMTAQDILKAAISLPDAERVALIEGLLASFGPEHSPIQPIESEWQQLALQRARELDQGTATTISWESVRQEGEQRLHGRSAD